MLRRVVASGLGAARHAQTTSHWSSQLVVRDLGCLSSTSALCSKQFYTGQGTWPSSTRSYATDSVDTSEASETIAADEPAAPKKRRRASSKKDTSDGTTSVTTKKKPGPKPKGATKKAAATKKKPAAKKKTVTKKPRAKKVEQSPAAKINELRKLALLHPPRMLPGHPYVAYLVEQPLTGQIVGQGAKEMGATYKALSLSEREHYQNIAAQNRIANAKTLQTWIEGYTPDQIRIANLARRKLNKLVKEPRPEGSKLRLRSASYRLIKDSRAVKKLESAYMAFVRERWASGEFSGTPAPETTRLLAAEWKVLGEGEKQKYKDAYAAHKEQYHKDYNAIFTRGIRSPPKTHIVEITE